MGRFGNSKRTLPENEEKTDSRAFSKKCAEYAWESRSYVNAYIRPRAQKRPEGTGDRSEPCVSLGSEERGHRRS